MPKNISEMVGRFIVKYIWLLCALLILLECISTVYSATVLMTRASSGVLSSVSGEISSRVDSTLKLITSLSTHEYISDTTKSTHERAVFTRSFQESYDLFMVAVTDKEGYVSSSDEQAPTKPEEQYNLMFRDYMQRLYQTGKYQITDPIVAGSDGKTLNYTIAVPIIKNDEVEGSVFGSIYFDEIKEIVSRVPNDSFYKSYLFGRDQNVISSYTDSTVGKSVDTFWEKSFAFGLTKSEMKADMENKKSGNFWVVDTTGFEYVLYQNVAGTEWTIVYSINFLAAMLPLLPAMIMKIVIYVAICFATSMLSRRNLKRQLSSVNQLIDTVSSMHRRLFQNDSNDYTTMLEITCEGLLDQLTGLSTRTLFYNKIVNWDFEHSFGAVVFIDLDNLKTINDTYGHEAGDAAIQSFGDVLKEAETAYDAISARYGGDEFVVVVNISTKEDINLFCEKLNQEMHKEITLNLTSTGDNPNQTPTKISVQASVGAALYPQHGTKIEDLIGKADLALYKAKRQGKGCWIIYSDDIM